MKKLLIAVLLACCQAVSAQNVQDLVFKQDLAKVNARIDSLKKAIGNGGTQNPPNDLPACKRGPKPESIANVTTTGAVVFWDGEDVFGWDYSIYKGNSRVAFGSVKPTSNREPITYAGLEPGEYTLSMQGNTCKSDVYSKTFTVPKPTGDNGNGGDGGNSGPPPIDGINDIRHAIMGTTGSGFQSSAEHGIDPQWVSRIEAFKYSWGYGITGICVWVPWDGYEKTPGKYEEAAFKRVIKFCRDRGLSLSVAFMGRRKRGDGFIQEYQIIKGSGDSLYIEGPREHGDVYASYGCDEVNAKMVGAIQSIAKLMKTYDKSFYMAMAGGGAGELVNHVFNFNDRWQVSDYSQDNLNRFNEWCIKRGIAGPGPPPVIQGPGVIWPHPDFNQARGVEFARFTTYGIYKYYKNFVAAVKSVSDIPCLYYYSVTSNMQFRAIANPNLNFIAGVGDGMYGSDGDGPDQLYAKIKVNSLNLGTFPNKISAAEVDPDDISPMRYWQGRMPKYCEGNLNYDAFLKVARDGYSRGLQVLHFAMSFCEQEIRGFEPVLKQLHQEYIGKPYVRPVVNASNTVTVEVAEKYRNSQDLMEGIDPYSQYTKYTDCNFWGPVKPEGATNCETSGPSIDPGKLTGFLDSNLPAYKGNVLVEVNTASGTVYSYARGSIGKDEAKPVASISKGVTAAAFLAETYDNGTIGLEDKVSKYLPAWRRPDKENITIRQVVSHTSGIHDETTFDGAATLAEAVDGMANTPLDFQPGSEYRYSTTSYQVLARIAEVVAGKNWEQIFNERIRYKCNMQTAEFNPRGPGPVYGNPANPLAGYGLYASLRDLSNFAAMLRDGGKFNGQQVLSAKAISLLKTNMTNGLGSWGFGFILGNGGLISESAKGLSLFVKPGVLSYVLMTQSTYEDTIGVNNGIRNMISGWL